MNYKFSLNKNLITLIIIKHYNENESFTTKISREVIMYKIKGIEIINTYNVFIDLFVFTTTL